MITRLDELLIDAIRPSQMSISDYVRSLKQPVGPLEIKSGLAAHEELLRIVRGWPDKDSPLSRCRLVSVLRQFKNALPLADNSFGAHMLKIVENSIPAGVMHIARLHEIGFSCFLFAHDLFEQTLQAFYEEKGVELDHEHQLEILQIYLLAVYHLGRSRMIPMQHREVILFGAHDSYNTFFLRPRKFDPVVPEQFAASYERVIERWVKAARESRVQSPSYALVRTVFNLLGMSSPMERMRCATLLEAGANHLLELSEVAETSRAAVRM